MGALVFSQAWAEAWSDEINTSEGYREAGARWLGPVGFLMEVDETVGVLEPQKVVLDLAQGRCIGARAGEAADLTAAAFVFAAPGRVWRRMLDEQFPPLYAVMTGKLRLVRGKLADLLPHTRGADELVAAARRLDAEFPPGWDSSPMPTGPPL
jgi:putative sterol carrier protein